MNIIHLIVFLTLSFSLLVSGNFSENQDVAAKNLCQKNDMIFTKLNTCSTATPFCMSFLGYTGAAPTVTLTATKTETSTVTKLSTSRITSTHALGGTVTSGVSTTATLTTKATTTVFTPENICTGVISVSYWYDDGVGSGSTPLSPRPYKTDCGLRRSAIGAVSSGCSCFLDPIVMTTRTKTEKSTSTLVVTVPKYTITVSGAITVPSSTITPISTSTVTFLTTQMACPTPDKSCGNARLEWAYYPAKPLNATNNLTDTNNIYSPLFEPANTKLIEPTYEGLTGEIGPFFSDDFGNWTMYGYSVPDQYVLVNYRGYFFAPQDGEYVFAYEYIDDKGWAWIGDEAYSGWKASNANEYVNLENCVPNDSGLPFCSYTVNLVSGTYYPYRNYFAQGNGQGGVLYSIDAPDGTRIADTFAYDRGVGTVTDINDSPYFVHYSCDGYTAPAYPPWSSET